MGVRGPVPKRDSERLRENKPDVPTDTVTMLGTVLPPELGDVSFRGRTHPMIEELYQSIRDSAAVKWYEPTDWQVARFTMLTLNQELVSAEDANRSIGAMKLAAINTMLSSLLLTEGDRRRVRLEIERPAGSSSAGKVVSLQDVLKQRLEAASVASGE